MNRWLNNAFGVAATDNSLQVDIFVLMNQVNIYIFLYQGQPKELTYHLLHPQSQEEREVENTLEGATIIYEQGESNFLKWF